MDKEEYKIAKKRWKKLGFLDNIENTNVCECLVESYEESAQYLVTTKNLPLTEASFAIIRRVVKQLTTPQVITYHDLASFLKSHKMSDLNQTIFNYIVQEMNNHNLNISTIDDISISIYDFLVQYPSIFKYCDKCDLEAELTANISDLFANELNKKGDSN